MDSLLPELMSKDELQQRLRSFVEPDRMPNDKAILISLAHQYLVPAPQRKFRSNRWGTLLTQTQEQSRPNKRARSPDSQNSEKSSVIRHESDRGIYTIHRQKSTTTNAPPIKLKRPTVIDDSDSGKRLKTEENMAS